MPRAVRCSAGLAFTAHARAAAPRWRFFCSLLETAKLCGVEPKRNLLAAARAAIAKPGTVLLPRDVSR